MPSCLVLTNVVLVLAELDDSAPKTLHSVVILSLVLSLSTSLLSAGFTFYNSVSNPYQTFLGSLGVYIWSGLSGEYAGHVICSQGAPSPASAPLSQPCQ